MTDRANKPSGASRVSSESPSVPPVPVSSSGKAEGEKEACPDCVNGTYTVFSGDRTRYPCPSCGGTGEKLKSFDRRWPDENEDEAVLTHGEAGGREGLLSPRPIHEVMARLFHAYYEQLAPAHGYETRVESAVPWDDLPANNRDLMLATCEAVLPFIDAALAREASKTAEAGS